MIERGGTVIEFAVPLKELPERGVHGPVHEGEVVFFRDDDANFDSPESGGVQRRDDLRFGEKVRSHDPDVFGGGIEGGENRPNEFVHVFVRTIGNPSGQNLALPAKFREPSFAAQVFLGGVGPVFGKGGLQMGHDRAANLKVKVLYGTTGVRCQVVGVTNVDAAGKAHLAVNDDYLAVVVEVECQGTFQFAGGEES